MSTNEHASAPGGALDTSFSSEEALPRPRQPSWGAEFSSSDELSSPDKHPQRSNSMGFKSSSSSSNVSLDFSPSKQDPEPEKSRVVCGMQKFSDPELRHHGIWENRINEGAKPIIQFLESTQHKLGITIRERRMGDETCIEYINGGNYLPRGTIIAILTGILQKIKPREFGKFQIGEFKLSSEVTAIYNAVPLDSAGLMGIFNPGRFPHMCMMHNCAFVPANFVEYDQDIPEGYEHIPPGADFVYESEDVDTDADSAHGSCFPTPLSRKGVTPQVVRRRKRDVYDRYEHQEPEDKMFIDMEAILERHGIVIPEDVAGKIFLVCTTSMVGPHETFTIDFGETYVGSRERLEANIKHNNYFGEVVARPCECQRDWKTVYEEVSKTEVEYPIFRQDDEGRFLNHKKNMSTSHEVMEQTFDSCIGDIVTGAIKSDCPCDNYILCKKDPPEVLALLERHTIKANRTFADWEEIHEEEINEVRTQLNEVREAPPDPATEYDFVLGIVGFKAFPLRDKFAEFQAFVNRQLRPLLYVIEYNRRKYEIKQMGDYLYTTTQHVPENKILYLSGRVICEYFDVPPEYRLDSCTLNQYFADRYGARIDVGTQGPLSAYDTTAIKPSCNPNTKLINPKFGDDGLDYFTKGVKPVPKDISPYGDFILNLLTEETHALLAQEFGFTEDETGNYTTLDIVGLGYTNEVVLPNTAITMNPCDRKQFQQGMLNLTRLKDELKEQNAGVLAFTCECRAPLPCPSNAVYLVDPAAHPECLDKQNIVTDSTRLNYETVDDQRDRQRYQLMIQSTIRQPWGKATEVPSKVNMDALRAIIEREHPGLDLQGITDEMDATDRRNQEEGQQTFEEYRMERRKSAGVSSSDDEESQVELSATKRTLLATLEEAVEYPAEVPRAGHATKRERSSLDEEGEQGEAKRAKAGKSSGGGVSKETQGVLQCHHCAEIIRKNEAKVNVKLHPTKPFFAPIHLRCLEGNKTYQRMGYLNICHLCKNNVDVNQERKKVSGGGHAGQYIHLACFNGNRLSHDTCVEYQADENPGEKVDTDDEEPGEMADNDDEEPGEMADDEEGC